MLLEILRGLSQAFITFYKIFQGEENFRTKVFRSFLIWAAGVALSFNQLFNEIFILIDDCDNSVVSDNLNESY